MGMTVKAWLPGQQAPQMVHGRTWGEAFDVAVALGAWRIVDSQTGQIYRCLQGEWVQIGSGGQDAQASPDRA